VLESLFSAGTGPAGNIAHGITLDAGFILLTGLSRRESRSEYWSNGLQTDKEDLKAHPSRSGASFDVAGQSI